MAEKKFRFLGSRIKFAGSLGFDSGRAAAQDARANAVFIGFSETPFSTAARAHHQFFLAFCANHLLLSQRHCANHFLTTEHPSSSAIMLLTCSVENTYVLAKQAPH